MPNRPVHVRSFGDFVTYFGTYRPKLFGAHVLNGFFQNGGGDAWVVRIVGTANPATATLNASGGGAVLNLQAGMLGLADPGDWATASASGSMTAHRERRSCQRSSSARTPSRSRSPTTPAWP